jgi:DNA-binding MarR family transcriptional regulator
MRAQSVSEIGRRVNLTSGSITTAIDPLEHRGPEDSSDRRARVVHRTRDVKARITKEFARHTHAVDPRRPRLVEGRTRHADGIV